jgi:hypothetical protein
MWLTDFCRSRSDDQDITMAELDTLMACHVLDIINRDAISVKIVVWLGLGFHIRFEVDQNAPTDKPAATMPVIEGGLSVVRGGQWSGEAFHRWLDPIVRQARRLVWHVDEVVVV